jgi:hypothetical protein
VAQHTRADVSPLTAACDRVLRDSTRGLRSVLRKVGASRPCAQGGGQQAICGDGESVSSDSSVEPLEHRKL